MLQLDNNIFCGMQHNIVSSSGTTERFSRVLWRTAVSLPETIVKNKIDAHATGGKSDSE